MSSAKLAISLAPEVLKQVDQLIQDGILRRMRKTLERLSTLGEVEYELEPQLRNEFVIKLPAILGRCTEIVLKALSDPAIPVPKNNGS